MKNIIVLLIFSYGIAAKAGSYLPWRLGYKTVKIGEHSVDIRLGYLIANPDKEFKGNILYYQGLGDSMLNHDPLFEVLTENGYRVIAFDYMGQGGSMGSMNNTTIKNINKLGDVVIKLLGRKKTIFKNKYHIIGWSTGGLAAYRKAFVDRGKTVSSMVLIAPGIVPNYIVGEGVFNWPVVEITKRTLTTNSFDGVNDPHEDPIFPRTPLLVPKFALNLQLTSKLARHVWKIHKQVKGLVLLSGKKDTYVDSKKTKLTLAKKAPHFNFIDYDDALHEIDNEKDHIAVKLREDILKFLDANKN